jgi:hypothetical protein
LSASSYGQNFLTKHIIEDADLRAKLLPASFGQTEVTDASHLIILQSKLKLKLMLTTKYKYYKRLTLEALAGYGAFMKGTINPMPEDMKNGHRGKLISLYTP